MSYPAKHRWDTSLTEIEEVRQALDKGLDPNVLWSEEIMVDPEPKSGCVVPVYVLDEDTWPHYNSPLHRALRFNDFESAKLLLEHQADINMYNSVGYTPLNEAVWNQNHEAIQFLLDHGADVNKPSAAACARWQDENRDIRGEGGGINLQTALQCSDYPTMRRLLEVGADLCPDAQHPWSPLDLALLASDRKAIEIMLCRGCRFPEQIAGRKPLDFKDIDPTASRALLSVTTSNTLVPPPELYHDAYCPILWQMNERQRSIGDDATVLEIDALVRDSFSLLETNADLPPEAKTYLCCSCRELQSQLACIYTTKKDFDFQLHKNWQELEQCAQERCLFCKITADALDFGTGEEGQSVEEMKSTVGWEAMQLESVMVNAHVYRSAGKASLMGMYLSCGRLRGELDMAHVDNTWLPYCNTTDSRTDSEEALCLAKEWLRECCNDSEHSACQEAYQKLTESDTLPGRLLYIEEPSGQLRIVDRAGVKGPYCALSYCWGLEPFTTTQRSNLSRHAQNIPGDELPPVMRDAVVVTRALGYQHLWVDALCIVQDDQEDWAREAARMHIIYSHADLTISSLASYNCNLGLFEPRRMRVTRPVVFESWKPKVNRSGSSSRVVFPEWAQKNACLRGPIHSRAWTLQEQLLSTRILYFGNGTIHWECLTGYSIEADPGRFHRRGYSFWHDLERRAKTKRAIKSIMSSDSNPQSSEAFEYWKFQLEEFTRRYITHAYDRLPAFSAVSEGLARAANNRSTCGIWSGDRMLESLCWRAVSPVEKQSTLMPTWTWLAVPGEVSFDLVERGGRGLVPVIPRMTACHSTWNGNTPHPTISAVQFYTPRAICVARNSWTPLSSREKRIL